VLVVLVMIVDVGFISRRISGIGNNTGPDRTVTHAYGVLYEVLHTHIVLSAAGGSFCVARMTSEIPIFGLSFVLDLLCWLECFPRLDLLQITVHAKDHVLRQGRHGRGAANHPLTTAAQKATMGFKCNLNPF